jgi:hypothetical protein
MRDVPALVISLPRCGTVGPGGAAGVAGIGRGGAEPLRDGGGRVLVVLGWVAAASGMTVSFRRCGGRRRVSGRTLPDAGGEGEAALIHAHQGGR